MKEPIEQYKLDLKKLDKDSSDFKKINCPSCSSETPAADINIQDKIAKCSSCNVVFSIETKVSSLLAKPVLKQEVIRPEGIDIFYFQDDLDITIKQPVSAGEIILACFVPFFTLIFTALFFFPKNGGSGPPAIFPVVSWILSGLLLANFINRSKHKIHIVVDDKMLSIYRKPKKFVKDKHFNNNEVNQIYVTKINHLFSIVAIVDGLDGQKHVPLIKGLTSFSKARFLEQEIERHLNIEDRGVPEELA